MTTEQLMSPRFEVIADYPYCPVSVNEQLEKVTETLFIVAKNSENSSIWNISLIEGMPHLFRKLNWWENRKKEDMPKKLKAVGFDDVYEIEEWDMDHMIGFVDVKERQVCDLRLFNPEYGYFPVDAD